MRITGFIYFISVIKLAVNSNAVIAQKHKKVLTLNGAYNIIYFAS